MKQYWAVKWKGSIRITNEPTENPLDACKNCYDTVHKDMMIKSLGDAKEAIKALNAIQSDLSKLTNWISILVQTKP